MKIMIPDEQLDSLAEEYLFLKKANAIDIPFGMYLENECWLLKLEKMIREGTENGA